MRRQGKMSVAVGGSNDENLSKSRTDFNTGLADRTGGRCRCNCQLGGERAQKYLPGEGSSGQATIRTVINLWQTDHESPYQKIEASSRHPYDCYARMIVETVGARRIDALDGRDLRRWHTEWPAPLDSGDKPRIAAARMAVVVLKNALTFAAGCRKPGCAELRNILRDMSFPSPRPSMEAPTAAERARDRASGCRAGVRIAIRRDGAAVGHHRQMGAARRRSLVGDH